MYRMIGAAVVMGPSSVRSFVMTMTCEVMVMVRSRP